MTVPSSVFTPVGARHARLFALNTGTGIIEPGSASATPYEGFHLSGLKEVQLNDPEPQQINHMGDDGIFTIDALPPTEAMTGTVMTGKIDFRIIEALTGDKNVAPANGERRFVGIGTNNRGSEVQVGMLVYRQAQDTDPDSPSYGLRRWNVAIFPKTLLIPLKEGIGGTEFSKSYTFRPQPSTAHLWGTQFSNTVEGFTRGQGVEDIAEYKPKIVAWKGDASLTAFNLPTAFPAVNTEKMQVWRYVAASGTVTEITADAGTTLAVASVTLSVAPAAGDILVCMYEHNQKND